MAVGFDETSIDIIELPKGIPAGMPYAIDDCSVANHLGFRNKVVWGVLLNIMNHYHVFEVPKSQGGMRTIHAPDDMMKLLLYRIYIRFLMPMHEQLGDHVTAYRMGRDVKDTVVQHIPRCPICDSATKTPKKHLCPRRGLLIKMDLSSFFHAHTRTWIRNYFKDLGYSHTVAGILAGLLTVPDVARWDGAEGEQEWYTRTPQGSPASGAICNLIADKRLDTPILKYLESLNTRYSLKDDWRWTYTRYADDLAFTCGINPPLQDRYNIIDDIQNIIDEAGYRVNHAKTRIARNYGAKNMLGIVFNQKPNYAKADYLRMRAITHNCATQGFETQYAKANQESAEAMILWLRGNINWINQINPDKGSKLLAEFDVALALHKQKAGND